ncbi:MAG: hypothetical protein HYY23_12725 [Verrucomicrobia bacterium]|nr:hypothetical protein [Verrucomicrobiota bacterium]
MMNRALRSKLQMVLLLLSGFYVAGCSKPTAPAAASTKSAAASPGTNVVAAKTEMNAASNELVLHKARFERKPGGRDPFFPASHRLPRVASDSPSSNAPPRLPLSSYIKLTGLRPSPTRPLAMINQTPFEPGERGDIAVSIPISASSNEIQKVRIRCVQIREDFVEIQIEGELGTTKLRNPVGP